jgi:hypothetical protein
MRSRTERRLACRARPSRRAAARASRPAPPRRSRRKDLRWTSSRTEGRRTAQSLDLVDHNRHRVGPAGARLSLSRLSAAPCTSLRALAQPRPYLRLSSAHLHHAAHRPQPRPFIHRADLQAGRARCTPPRHRSSSHPSQLAMISSSPTRGDARRREATRGDARRRRGCPEPRFLGIVLPRSQVWA